MAYARVNTDTGEILATIPTSTPFILDGFQYPSNWLALATPEERESLNLYPIEHVPAQNKGVYYTTVDGSMSFDPVARVVEVSEVSTPLSLDAVLAIRLEDLRRLRSSKETGGFVFNGITVPTDLTSQAKINAAYNMAVRNPQIIVKWQVDSGTFVQLDAASLIAMADAVALHVQACFTTQAMHAEALKSKSTFDEVLAYDITSGWPE